MLDLNKLKTQPVFLSLVRMIKDNYNKGSAETLALEILELFNYKEIKK